jgi:hypothetical protein
MNSSAFKKVRLPKIDQNQLSITGSPQPYKNKKMIVAPLNVKRSGTPQKDLSKLSFNSEVNQNDLIVETFSARDYQTENN